MAILFKRSDLSLFSLQNPRKLLTYNSSKFSNAVFSRQNRLQILLALPEELCCYLHFFTLL